MQTQEPSIVGSPERNILLVDKPAGITSFDVIRKLRHKLNVKKIGHAGTLDPLATGLLVLGLNEGTKELARFTNLPKVYETTVVFGATSTTYDADGELTQHEISPVTREAFEEMLKAFVGKIEQRPPAFSAKKIKGKRAYELARKGLSPLLKLQEVHIFSIEVLDWNFPAVRLRVKCGKGAYIRSLAHDMGQKLGCGGYVKELRRTAIGQHAL